MTSAAAHPSVLAAHARAANNLERYFEDEEVQLKRDVRSGEAMFEAQMDARSKLDRHRPLAVRGRLPGGGLSRVLWFDAGIRGGLIATGIGSEGGGAYELDAEKMHQQIGAVGYFRRLKEGMDAADVLAPTKGWVLEVPPSHVLALRYRNLLPRERWPFDPQGKAFATKKAPPLASGFVLNNIRGPGNLAHLTASARAAYGYSRTRRDLAGWVDWLGKKLGPGTGNKVTPAERALAGQISDECIILETLTLSLYVYAARSVRRVPAVVQRRARAATG